jgi:hypothetical protein
MRKKLLIENDISELDDFRKILLLNKKKINSDNVEFYDDNGNDYEDIIEITPDGIIFNFNDLEQFLKFFFPNTYGEEGGDSEWDARNYDSMYYDSYDWSDDCYDRSSDDWDEGYAFGYICNEGIVKLRELISIVSPSLLKYFKTNNNNQVVISEGPSEIASTLGNIFSRIDDDITEIICDSKSKMLGKVAPEYIENTFCDGLKPLGIVNWRNKCFNTYFISWGSLVQMYLDKGDFSDNALNVMFNYIDKHFNDHPPVYYEVEYNVFDQQMYDDFSCDRMVQLIENYIERAHVDFNPKYVESVNNILKLGLFSPKIIPGGDNTYYIKVKSIDPETLQTKYVIGRDRWMSSSKYGLAPVDEVINIATQPGLFDQTEFRVDPTWSQR